LPAGTLVRVTGEPESVKERRYGQVEDYVPFVSEFGQGGYVRLNEVTDGRLSTLEDAVLKESGERLACRDIARIVAPDSPLVEVEILAEPREDAAVLKKFSASYMATVIVIGSDYDEESLPGRFLKIRYRVGNNSPFLTGYLDRLYQSSDEGPGSWRLSGRLSYAEKTVATADEKNCSGNCWRENIKDMFSFLNNLDDVANSLQTKACGIEEKTEFEIEAGANAGILAKWLNIGIGANVGRTFSYTFPADEVASVAGIFVGSHRTASVRRTHKCVGSDRGPVTHMGVKFAELPNSIQLVLADISDIGLPPIPERVRDYHNSGFLLVPDDNSSLFGKFVKLRHRIQNHIERQVVTHPSDDDLFNLDRLTWVIIGEAVEFQDRRAD